MWALKGPLSGIHRHILIHLHPSPILIVYFPRSILMLSFDLVGVPNDHFPRRYMYVFLAPSVLHVHYFAIVTVVPSCAVQSLRTYPQYQEGGFVANRN